MVRTAIQLHTLRDVNEPLPDVLARVGETSFDGVEFYDGQFDELADPAALEATQEALSDAGLEVPGAHVSIERIESERDQLLETCRALDCPRVVVPSYEPEAFADRESVAAVADHLWDLVTAVDGLELLYHNHTFEFGDVNGGVAFEAFADDAGDRFGFEPDVGLATHAGYDALDLLDVVGDRGPLVHLTDSDPTDPRALHADPGEGVVDLAAAAEAAVGHGAEWLVCENGVSSDPHATLQRGSDAFASLQDRIDSR